MSNLVEQGYYRLLGVRKEYVDPNPVAQATAATLLIARTKLHVFTHHSQIQGYPLPRQGAAIVTGNHNEAGDSFKGLQHAIKTAGRLIRPVVKRSLLEEGAIESMEYLRSIDAQTESLGEYTPRNAFVLRHTGAIGVLRNNPGLNFVRAVDQGLKNQHLMAIYLQPTRNPDCFLRHLQPGAAYFAMKHPEIPVYPVAFSNYPDKVDLAVFMEPFTYAQKVAEYGQALSEAEFTVIIADSIARGLPNKAQIDWTTRRSQELQHLNSRKK